jgi:hypothetical protein
MKSKAIITLATLLLAGAAKSQTSWTAQVNADASKPAFNLQVNNPEKKKLHITIEHRNMGVVVDTVIFSTNFSQLYLFNDAEDGTYIIAVDNGKEEYIKEIELTTVTTRNMTLRSGRKGF